MRFKLYGKEEWKEADTKELLFNGIRDTNGCIWTDIQIEKVEDDIRSGYVKCNQCGATFKLDEIEEHFLELERKPCTSCRHFADTYIKSEPLKLESEYILENNRVLRKLTKTEIIYYERKCNISNCLNSLHRRRGFTEFTEENTFFLRYPNGIPKIKLDEEKLKEDYIWYTEDMYSKGDFARTYHFEIRKISEDVYKFLLRNSRTSFDFFICDNETIIRQVYENGTSLKEVPIYQLPISELAKKELIKFIEKYVDLGA